MDGRKRSLNRSIQFRLSCWLSLAIATMAIIAGIISYTASYDEAHELQDHVLRQIAALYDLHHLPASKPARANASESEDEESQVIVQYLSKDSENTQTENIGISLSSARTLLDGMYTLTIDREDFRVLVKTLARGERIAVAQEIGLRDEIARDSALHTVMPFLVMTPLLLLAVAYLIRQMLKPITTLANEVDQRSEQELHPLTEENIPAEVKPFVIAINRMLGRVSKSVEAQKRFVANTAHELRSPLTALSLQAERLADAEMSDTARERLETLRKGIDRNRNLLEQLLSLARAQSINNKPDTSISVQQVYRRVLEDMMPLAEAKQIDLGINGNEDAQVFINEVDLITLVKNLVDNAIRYTPPGGRVDVSVQSDKQNILLQVTDTGAGIPVKEYERIFDPFYRILGNNEIGSGLGLSIVAAIVNRIGGTVTLSYADEQKQIGLCVKVMIASDYLA